MLFGLFMLYDEYKSIKAIQKEHFVEWIFREREESVLQSEGAPLELSWCLGWCDRYI